MTRITRAVTYDIRFPTSLTLAGSDAMNTDPDYSAAYVVLETDDPRGIEGHGLTFTIGRGTEVCVAAIAALAPVVAGVGFTYVEDALTREEALALLRRNVATRAQREAILVREGFPAYTTSAGWMGYAEDSLPERAHQALAEGFTHLKLKVGSDPAADLRRATIVRDAIGPDVKLSLDANQAWGVTQAIAAMESL